MTFKNKGFTLLEILLVVGIISVLAGIVIIAINPGRQLATVRNTERKSDLKQINNAMQQFYIDNGAYPAATPSSLTEICDTGTLPAPSGVACGTLIDLSALVPTYITAIPTDPAGASSTLTLITPVYAADGGTGYKVGLDTNNKLIVTAPLAELGASIVIGTTTGTTTGGTTGCVATGGTVNEVGGYKIHTFTSIGSDTLNVTSGPCDVDVLVVAGGGTGGGKAGTNDWFGGGGGGAGGIVVKTAHVLSSVGDYAVTVGAGGVWDDSNLRGGNGGDSVFDTITAIGGGYGGNNSLYDISGYNPTTASGQDGGSGGGAGANGTSYFGQSIQGPSGGGTGFGNFGGYAQGGDPYPMGGGGGASTEGGTGSGSQSGAGGDGLFNNFSGVSVLYGGGGGGAAHEFGALKGLGGPGGGGDGAAWDGNHSPGSNGVANTGGGGGGGQSTGGAGGSGIVIVRYTI